MNCEACNGAQNTVLEVRGDRRRRECDRCHHRWTTYEVMAARLEHLERIEVHATAIAQELEAAAAIAQELEAGEVDAAD